MNGPVGLRAAQPGAVLAVRTRHLARADLVAYAHASGDDNPIHQDETAARSVGLPDVIAHGMLTMGVVGTVVEELAGGAERVRTFAARFAAPVVVPRHGGADLDIVVSLLARDETTATLDAAVSVAGTKVLSRARAVIALE